MTGNEILEHVVVKAPCISCGDHVDVSLRQIAESQELLHDIDQMWDEGCPNYCREPACELVTRASLVDEAATRDAVHAINEAVNRLSHAGAHVDVACAPPPGR